MVQNGSNMAPKSTQVGAMLGSKTVMDPPKSEAKTMSKKCLQKVDFLSHLGGILGRYKQKKMYQQPTPGGPAELTRGVGGLQICKNWQELARTGMVSSTAAPPSGGRRIHLPYGPTPPPCLGLSCKVVELAKLVKIVKLIKLLTLSISNQTKIDQNRPRIDPESSQNRPKIDQDRQKIELGWGLGAIWAPRWLREPT